MFIDFGFIKPPKTMLKNYLLIAIRTFVRNRTTSFVNFLGLTIGLACSLLIFLHVNEELGYDRFHSKSNRIFRVLSIDNALGVSNNVVGITIPALAQAMKAEIPEVEDVVRIAWVGRNLVKYEENTFYAENTFLTDQSFLEVFDFELIEGDRKTCLVEPNSTIITKSMADKLFGDQNPMGKIFTAAGSNDLVVSGILKDETRPTHLKFDIVISLNPSPSDSTSAQFLNSWRSIAMVEYSLAKDKGFNASQIVNIRLDNRDLFEKYKTLEEELKKIPGIKMIAASSSMPGLGYGRRVIIPEGSQDTDTWITSVFSANENFIPLMEMELVEGENFRENMSLQPSPVIVNQSLVKAAGWENGLNKTIKLGNGQEMQVIGVIKDFHFTSLRHSIEPIMISYRAGANGVVSLRVDESNMGQTIKSIEQAWKNVNGSIPFEYKFFDETFAYLFDKEKEFSMLFFRFTLLSIFIAVLGVFGLATYSAEQRTKEIGIRKTFGGTTKQMLMLQTNDYTMLILFAIVIGTPISIKLMSSWLEGFEYRISLDSTPFILASILSLVVTISTVSIQSFRAAQMNPTESLKYE